MAPKLPPGVKRVTKRKADGTTAQYHYLRATGERLPDPADPGFAKAVALAKRRPATQTASTELHDLITEYFRSPDFQRLSASTVRQRRLHLLRLEGFGVQALSQVGRGLVLSMRDTIAARHGNGSAYAFLQSLSGLFAWALDRERVLVNPCAKIRPLPLGEWEAWTDAEVEHALTSLIEPYRRAVLLAVYTGQRRSDLCSMTWGQVAGRFIHVTQQKTGAKLALPIHPALADELSKWRAERTSTHVLTNKRGRPWPPESLTAALHRALKEVGLPRRGIHGLRKVAARRLAEAGCSIHEIAAITGHKSLGMVAHYTKSADQRQMAEAAMDKLTTGNGNRRKPSL